MTKRISKKLKSTILGCCALIFFSAIVTEARIVITTNQSLDLVGSSGSVYRNTAKGYRNNSSLSDYLYSGIRRGSNTGFTWGAPAGGNKVYLTAYSPSMVGSYSQMQGSAMVR